MRILVLLALLWSPACTREISEADLVGVYRADHGGDTAILTLRADHTYTNTIRLPDGQSLQGQAAWKSTVMETGRYIEFTRFGVFPSYAKNNSLASREMSWTIEVSRTYLGRVEICFDDDVGYCYFKEP